MILMGGTARRRLVIRLGVVQSSVTPTKRLSVGSAIGGEAWLRTCPEPSGTNASINNKEEKATLLAKAETNLKENNSDMILNPCSAITMFTQLRAGCYKPALK